MPAADKQTALCVESVLGRLKQVHGLWFKTRASYFDPHEFLVNLQHCIVTSRTVSWVLKKHKAVVPDFEEWYAPYEQRFREDPIMRWAVAARNKIEKQGDLETLSQIRVELVASYLENPKTEWLPASVFSSVDDIRDTVPFPLRTRHLWENGVIQIQRRWVDTELPNHELLDALAHVYGQLAAMVVDLHQTLGIRVPPEDHILDVGPDRRLSSMLNPTGEYLLRTRVKDGSAIEYSYETSRLTKEGARKAKKRVDLSIFDQLKTATNFAEVAEGYFHAARATMLKDHYHVTLSILLRDNVPIEMVQTTPRDRADKYLLMQDMARRVQEKGANGFLHIAESWLAHRDDLRPGEFPSEAKKRQEALTLTGINADGDQISLSAIIERKKIKKHKVKRLLPTVRVDGQGALFMMAPILAVWGKSEFEDPESATGESVA